MGPFRAVPRYCCLCACMLAAWTPSAPAQTVNFSLNVFYTNSMSTASGGAWEVVAKSSNFGIAGVDLHLQNIQTATLRAPRGTVNGNDPAGFNLFINATFPNFTIAQTPNGALMPGEQQGAFYGVGQLANGAPNYPMQPAGTNSEGPSLTSLTSTLEIPWATGDVFGDANWNTAARLLSGTFAAGVTPAFGAGNDANIFTSLPVTADQFGTSALATTVTTIIRTNFGITSADYNKNGIVDAADYVLWRKQNGTMVPPFSGADGNGDGMVDQADYTLWRSRFGLPFGAGSGAGLSTTAVPEPTAAVFIAVAAMLLLITLRRSRDSLSLWERAGVRVPCRCIRRRASCLQPVRPKRINFCAMGRK